MVRTYDQILSEWTVDVLNRLTRYLGNQAKARESDMPRPVSEEVDRILKHKHAEIQADGAPLADQMAEIDARIGWN